MEAKKTKKADLRGRRALFFEAGLALALAGVVSAFAWGSSEKEIVVFVPPTEYVTPDVVANTDNNPPPEKVKPMPVQAISEYINVVRNDAKITTDPYFPTFDDPVIVIPPTEDPIEPDIPLYNAEEMPSFRGGDLNDFRNWVSGQLQYPRMAVENNIQGKVTLKFVVEKDGSLSSIEEIASPDRLLTDEATRVLLSSPKWSPGRQRGKAVRVIYILPVEFALQSN